MLFSKGGSEVSDVKNLKDVEKPICEISGSWLNKLIIGNETYWDIERDHPKRQIPLVKDVLSSDWRYREDLIWLKYGYTKIA